jgi:hypothetical protein
VDGLIDIFFDVPNTGGFLPVMISPQPALDFQGTFYRKPKPYCSIWGITLNLYLPIAFFMTWVDDHNAEK